MAQIISIAEVASARRRVQRHQTVIACLDIIEANVRLAMGGFAAAPPAERPLRARQLRQLAELLEYVSACV